MSSRRKNRRVMSLTEKIEVLNLLAKGSSAVSVGRRYGINESTVRYIKKAEERIRSSVSNGAPRSAKTTYITRRDTVIEKTEKILSVWIERALRNGPINQAIIRENAVRLYRRISEREGVPVGTFQASKGWFYRFKRRCNIGDLNVMGKLPTTDHQIDQFELSEEDVNRLLQFSGYQHNVECAAMQSLKARKQMPFKAIKTIDEIAKRLLEVARIRKGIQGARRLQHVHTVSCRVLPGCLKRRFQAHSITVSNRNRRYRNMNNSSEPGC